MKVFISSTIYDLLDVRSEVAAFLQSLGAVPLLSDDKLSSFEVSPSANSIETCLINVRNSEHFIVVLDQRYGPSLGQAGFEDISATHLEYREAIRAGIPVHFFVRDRLEADYAIWKKNKEAKLAWVKGSNAQSLFTLMDEHYRLTAKSNRSNWRHIYATSMDLKAAMDKLLGKPLLGRKLVEAIETNRFPLFEVSGDTIEMLGANGMVKFVVTFRNGGNAPAFNVQIHIGSGWRAEQQISLPGSEMVYTSCIRGPKKVDEIATLTYETALGVAVGEEWRIGIDYQGGVSLTTVVRNSRRFKYSRPPKIEIGDE